ncbi:Mitochondrial inner membrane protease subunit [Musa troglodytarum]|uniref:Cyclin-dependent kinases regulatory subunit n=1 Tax=Musa troglodytarum TaxID=320322 RepID=A0A9E7JM17_9LILI|nr:Mitochondrial inner membrane protease subunit [Musa troglodytarum]
MLLSAPEDSEKRTTTVCSCYAPIKRQHSKSCEGSESKRVIAPMKGHANGQGPPADPNLPPPPPPPLPPPLKSNLKKPTTVGEQQMMMVRDERRKVSWPDAHGRDLAHVQVFHSRFKCLWWKKGSLQRKGSPAFVPSSEADHQWRYLFLQLRMVVLIDGPETSQTSNGKQAQPYADAHKPVTGKEKLCDRSRRRSWSGRKIEMGQIQYSEKYFDDTYEYRCRSILAISPPDRCFFECRHVVLPPEVAKLLPKNRLLSENEWRAIGVQQSRGWVHYAIHRPEPHIMLFRRPLNYQQQQENQAAAAAVHTAQVLPKKFDMGTLNPLWFFVKKSMTVALFGITISDRFATVYSLTGTSMSPTFTTSSPGFPGYLKGDIVLVEKFCLEKYKFSRGDVIAFKSPSDHKREFVKRLIALPGDWMQISDTSDILKIPEEMEAELCSVHTLSPSQGESGDEELSVLPRHTKVIVTGNNRTKSVLVGLQGVVKKAVGLGGWHWLVLKNGEEVKLQRNALSVLEAPTGNEDDEIDCDTSFCSSSDMGEKDMDYTGSEFHKPRKSRIRHTRSWKSNGQSSIKDIHSHGFKPRTRVRLSKLETATLWRYWKHFNLVSSNPSPTKEQLVHDVQHHFLSQKLDETEVILGFIHAAKRLRILYS